MRTDTTTDTQRQALRELANRNTGALLTSRGWTWPQHVRESEEAAQAVLTTLARLAQEGR